MLLVSKYLSTAGNKGKTEFVENLFPVYQIPHVFSSTKHEPAPFQEVPIGVTVCKNTLVQ